MFEPTRCTATIAVSDLERAKQFYGITLGLQTEEERADGVTYRTGGGTTCFVYPSQFAGTSQGTSMGFEVADLDLAMKELRGSGVTFEEYDLPGLKTVEGIADIEGTRAAWFKDPDGTIIAVEQRG